MTKGMISGKKEWKDWLWMYRKLCIKIHGWKGGQMDGWIHLSRVVSSALELV